jgi:hypothetical protein
LVFFEQGNLRLAWGCAAAAAVSSFALYRGLYFPANATENDCAALVNSSVQRADEGRAFGALIGNWVNFAYAGRIPPQESFEEALAFLRSLRPENE